MVRLPNPLGDAVMAIPLLSNIKQQFPDCHLTLVGDPAYELLFEGATYLDTYVALDRRSNLRSQAKILRQHNCDTIVLCPNSWSSSLVAFLAGIKQRIGRRHHARQLLLTHSLPSIDKPRLMTDLYCELLAAFDLEYHQAPVRLPTTELRVAWAPVHSDYFVVAPGAAFGSSKQYPLPLMAEVINKTSQSNKLLPVLIGSPAEHYDLTRLAGLLTAQSIIAPQDAGLNQTKQVISNAKFIICMDSGARHIAAAVDTPQIVVFGPTDPTWTAHTLSYSTFISNTAIDCLGCHEKKCPLPNHPCMTELDPQLIIDESSRLSC